MKFAVYMNKVATAEVIACAGTTTSGECARIMAAFERTGQCDKYRFVMAKWLSADQLRRAILLWIVDNSQPWDKIHLALSHRIPLLVPEGNSAVAQLCVSADCGIWYRNEADARLCLEYLLSSDTIRARLGANGQAYLAGSNAFAQLPRNLVARTNNHSGA